MSASMFIILIPIIILSFNAIFVEASGHLPVDEINALKEIAEEMGKKDWDFTLNPCDNNSNWRSNASQPDFLLYYSSLTCNCNFPAGICHVQSIVLRGQDLQGVLPPSLVKLPFLKIIDLRYNYLSGTIPLEWASTKLENISVAVNRLSGPIPKYLGNITTLVRLHLKSNMFDRVIRLAAPDPEPLAGPGGKATDVQPTVQHFTPQHQCSTAPQHDQRFNSSALMPNVPPLSINDQRSVP